MALPAKATTKGITKSEVNEIAEEHRKAQEAFGSAIQHAIRCGELLTEAKGKVKHGEWLPWLEKNFDFTRQTASGYMRLATAAERGELEGTPSISGALKQLSTPVGPKGPEESQVDLYLDMAVEEVEANEQHALEEGKNPKLVAAEGNIERAIANAKAHAMSLLELANHTSGELSDAAGEYAHLVLAAPEPWELTDAKAAASERLQEAVAAAGASDQGGDSARVKDQADSVTASQSKVIDDFVKANEAEMKELGVTSTPTGLDIPEGLPPEDWIRLGDIILNWLQKVRGRGLSPASLWDIEEQFGALVKTAREIQADRAEGAN